MVAVEDAEPLTLTGVVLAGAPHVAEAKEEMMRLTQPAEHPVNIILIFNFFPKIVTAHAHAS
jgi:hypothetical protein